MKPKLAPRHIAAGVVLVGLGWLLNSASQPFQRNARTSMCQSNLKQIGVAMFQYQRDYDERFPLADNWADSLKVYVVGVGNDKEDKFQQLFRCPTSESYYAFNNFFSGQFDTGWENRSMRGETALTFDVSWSTRNFSDDGSLWPLQPIHGRGKYGGNVVLFADAHVKLMTVKPEFRPLLTLTPQPTPKPTPKPTKIKSAQTAKP